MCVSVVKSEKQGITAFVLLFSKIESVMHHYHISAKRIVCLFIFLALKTTIATRSWIDPDLLSWLHVLWFYCFLHALKQSWIVLGLVGLL